MVWTIKLELPPCHNGQHGYCRGESFSARRTRLRLGDHVKSHNVVMQRVQAQAISYPMADRLRLG
jgi:hypothetical protein